MQAKTVLFEMLRDRGVRHVFGNPGTTELNFMEMFADYPEITYVLALQDAIPVGMAYGFAQASGAPAFVNLHITPGLANGLGVGKTRGRQRQQRCAKGNAQHPDQARGCWPACEQGHSRIKTCCPGPAYAHLVSCCRSRAH